MKKNEEERSVQLPQTKTTTIRQRHGDEAATKTMNSDRSSSSNQQQHQTATQRQHPATTTTKRRVHSGTMTRQQR